MNSFCFYQHFSLFFLSTRPPSVASVGGLRPPLLFLFSFLYITIITIHMSSFSLNDLLKNEDAYFTKNSNRLNDTHPVDFSKFFKFFVFYLLHFFCIIVILYNDKLHILALFTLIFINTITHLSIISHFIHFNNNIYNFYFSSFNAFFIFNIIIASFANFLILFFFFKLYFYSISHNTNISLLFYNTHFISLLKSFESFFFSNIFFIPFLSILFFLLFPLYLPPIFFILFISFFLSIYSIYLSVIISNFNISYALSNDDNLSQTPYYSSLFNFFF